jgi:hypothetical protein
MKPKQGFDPPFSAHSQAITIVLLRPVATANKPIESLIREEEAVKRRRRLVL